MVKPHLFIDADSLLYKAAFASEKEIDWGNDMWTLTSDLRDAKDIFTEQIIQIQNSFDEDWTYVLCFTGEDNFRKDIFPEYKANRKKQRKPLALKPLREWAMFSYDSLMVYGLEADDILGLYADDGVLVSIDKDLRTVAGLHFNHDKIEKGIQEVTEEEAHYNHMMQTLCGDTTDGYGGCPKVGPKTAAKILDVPQEDMWNAVVKAYKKQGLSEDYAIVQAQLARILRGNEYNWDTCELNLWSPEGGET